MSLIPLLPGRALVNVLSAFPDLDELERDFDVLYFLDLCAGIEAAILHESLVSVGPVKGIGSGVNPIVDALAQADVLSVYRLSTSDLSATTDMILAHPNARAVLAMLPGFVPAVNPDPHISLISTGTSLAADVGFEGLTGLPLVQTAHSLPLYSRLPSIQAERKAAAQLNDQLAQRYADFRQVLHALRDKSYGRESIRIPPIALEVLAIANDHTELGAAVLEVRHKYAAVRTHFTELDEMMRANTLPPHVLLKEQAKRQKAISKLFTTEEVDGLTVLTSFATELNDLTDLADIADGVAGIDWNKLVGSILHHAEDCYWKFRLRPLHSTKRHYLQLSNKSIGDLVRRHFGHPLTDRDLAKAKAFSKVVSAVEQGR